MPGFKIVKEFRDETESRKGDLQKFYHYIRTLSPKIPAYRLEMLEAFRENENVAIEEIASADALATVPVMIHVLTDIKKRNNAMLGVFLKEKIGKDLAKESIVVDRYKKEEYTIDDYFKPHISRDIISIFENFIFNEIKDNNDYDTCVGVLTEAAVEEKINRILNEFYLATATNKLNEQDKKQLENLLRIDIFVSSAIKTFVGADDAQKMYTSWDEAMFFKQYYGNVKLRKPFMALSFCIKKIEIPKELNEPWHEVRFYLKGFFKRVVNMMPPAYKNENGEVVKKSDGTYESVDPQDAKLKSTFGISKYDVIVYDRHMAQDLDVKLMPIKDVPRILVVNENEYPAYYAIADRSNELDLFSSALINLQLNGKGDFESKVKCVGDIIRIDALLPFEIVLAIDDELKANLKKCYENYIDNKSGIFRTLTNLAGWTTENGEYGVKFKKLLENIKEKDPQDLLKELFDLRYYLIAKQSITLRPMIDQNVLVPLFDRLSRPVQEIPYTKVGNK